MAGILQHRGKGREVKGPQARQKKDKSFRDRQLKLSGLTEEDQRAIVFIERNHQSRSWEHFGRAATNRRWPNYEMRRRYADLVFTTGWKTHRINTRPKSSNLNAYGAPSLANSELHKDKGGRADEIHFPMGQVDLICSS